jgi:hypothetical protein
MKIAGNNIIAESYEDIRTLMEEQHCTKLDDLEEQLWNDSMTVLTLGPKCRNIERNYNANELYTNR